MRIGIRAATLAAGFALAAGCVGSHPALAAPAFLSTADPATILYDAPSDHARPLFVYGRDVPVEVLVAVEGWTKVRDVAGTIGWIASKSLAAKRMVEVRTPVAEVHARADDAAPIVFRAEHDVLLQIAENAASPAAAASPGWVRVRHRDGQTGYVRLAQIFGF